MTIICESLIVGKHQCPVDKGPKKRLGYRVTLAISNSLVLLLYKYFL